MSNLKPNSVIACLDDPDYVQAVIDGCLWSAKMLQAPIGLLHAVPSVHRKAAVDYSGCLTGDAGEALLNQLVLEEKEKNGKLRDHGRILLRQADNYCQQNLGHNQLQIYTLHRHASIAESLDYVDESAQMIVLGHKLTCKNTLSHLIRASRCPILVTQQAFSAPKTALFAFDNRSTCHKLVDWLCGNSLLRNIVIHVVMVGADNERNKDAIREAYARLKQAGFQCKKALIEGRDVTATLMYYQKQNQLDMLVTGAFGESRLHELLHGSDTRQLLKASSTPYLLYPRA